MNVVYALLLAHFLSDFVFQSNRQVRAKQSLRPSAHLAHGGVVTGTSLALTWVAAGDPYVGLALAVGLLHVAQDWAKDRLRARWSAGPSWMWIAADQAVHIAVIWLMASLFGFVRLLGVISSWISALQAPGVYVGAIVVVLGTWVAGVLLREALAPLVPGAPAYGRHESGLRPEALLQTSFWIGIVERTLVIAAVAAAGTQGFATAGLVVAAKSIFRWRDLDSEPNAAHYYLLGTLASITVAVVAGLLVRRVLG